MLSITLFIFNVVFKIVFGLFSLLPSFGFELPEDLLSGIAGFMEGVAFFLPMRSLATLFEIKIILIQFRIAWAIFLRIKSFIPEISST
ncbi:MAG: hypothetical protein J6T10_23940 [Methanobrevibacter sp.]|nr:hypothetical protein [Methanobrevibacter sp.]